MNAYVPKEEIALLRPNTLSHYFKDDAPYVPAPERTRPSLSARIGSFFRVIADLPRRHAVMQELHALSDHELSDIGLVRSDLGRVFDREFLERRNVDRRAVNA
jgi:uncharacterized protein YjiS (DUF1127 family)